MMKQVFLSQINPDSGLFQVEALRVGQWAHPDVDGGSFTITPPMLSEMVANFKEGAKGFEVELNLDHGSPCGWVKDVRLSQDGTSLFALFDVTEPSVRERVENGTIKFASSEIDLAWDDPEDGQRKVVFEGLALTNHPYVKRMEPVKKATVNLSDPFSRKLDLADARQHSNGGNMNETNVTLAEHQREIAALRAQLAETAAKDQQIRDLSERLALMEARQADVQKDVQLSEVRAQISRLFRRGKLTVPAYQRAIRLTETLIKGGAGTVKLSTRVKLAEGEDSIDKLDVIKEVTELLGELPDAIGVDPAQMDLEEDENPMPMDPAMGGDDDLLAQADAIQKEDPTKSRADAVALAAKRRGVTTLSDRKVRK